MRAARQGRRERRRRFRQPATNTGATVLALNVRETVVTANSGDSFGHQVLFGVTAAPGPALAGQAQRMVSAMAAMGGGAAGTASGLATTSVAGATNLAAPSGVRPHPV